MLIALICRLCYLVNYEIFKKFDLMYNIKIWQTNMLETHLAFHFIIVEVFIVIFHLEKYVEIFRKQKEGKT